MNDKLKNLNIEPDKEVWQKVTTTIHRRTIMRRVLWTMAVAVAVGAVLLAFFPKLQSQSNSKAIASHSSTTAIVDETVMAEEIIPQEQPVAKKKAIPQMQSQIDEQPLVVEEPKTIAPVESKELSSSESSSVTIIGGADGPTAIFVSDHEPIAIPNQTASATPQPKAVDQPQPAPQKEVAEVAQPVAPIAQPVVDSQPTHQSPKSPVEAPEESILWIPNAFAPESDLEENRVFKVVANDMILDYRINIFDRSGRRVYESNDVYASWNGTKGGMRLPQAAYVYVINYKDRNGKPHTEKGTVTLVR